MRKSKLPAEPIIGLLKQPLLHTRSWMRLNYQFQLLQWSQAGSIKGTAPRITSTP